MANLTKTLKAQTVNNFGPSPSTKWGGTFLWTPITNTVGNGCWGMKSAAVSGIPVLQVVFGGNFSISFNSTFHMTYGLSTKNITDGSGHYYQVPDRTTNFEIEFFPVYTSAAAASTVYTSASVATTIWS